MYAAAVAAVVLHCNREHRDAARSERGGKGEGAGGREQKAEPWGSVAPSPSRTYAPSLALLLCDEISTDLWIGFVASSEREFDFPYARRFYR